MNEKYELELPKRPEVSRENRSSLSRDTVMAMAHRHIGATAADLLLNTKKFTLEGEGLHLTPEVREWAEEKIFQAVEKWQPYADILSHPLPMDGKGLHDLIPHLGNKLTDLYEVAEKAGEIDSARLLFIPYQEFKDNIQQLPTWLSELRERSGLNQDSWPMSIYSRLNSEDHLYVDGRYQMVRMSLSDYLQMMNEYQNEWGLALVGNPSSVLNPDASQNLNPYSYIRLGLQHHLGILEWISYTLQENLKEHESIIFPGSYISHSDQQYVACGYFSDEENRYEMAILPSKGLKKVNLKAIPYYSSKG